MKEIKKGIVELEGRGATRKLGLEIANALEPGDVVALVGELGTGKTALTGYIAEGLGIKEEVVSPTFTIVKLYEEGRIPLAHFDIYRLGGSEELLDVGAGEIIGGRYASVIEWADIAADILPADSLLVHLSYGEGEDERRAEIL
ncbi:MAG: tRNA (adenosine(37)-N6)-threonylcarbamoyltransferase complex ATPase subunit type 1 TsaE [Mogibacterium sp.]|nr:tRNA (adenosine(37)-N6)-threonylcarbamoyltransferase complex ATPase subunit type 1 TsaE [Mogibacterium sp.]